MLILNVPFNEKDEAKKLGARWNPDIKKWYIHKREDYYKFAKWILPYGNIIVCDSIYIIEGEQKCFKCTKNTRVIGFGLEKYIYMEMDDSIDEDGNECEECVMHLSEEYNDNNISIVGTIYPIPQFILEYVQNNYNYKMRYSKTTKESHMNNCCEHCDVLQGDFFLFEEVDSPFYLDSIEKVKKLKIFKIPLKTDIIIQSNIVYDSESWMLKEYGNIIPLKIKEW